MGLKKSYWSSNLHEIFKQAVQISHQTKDAFDQLAARLDKLQKRFRSTNTLASQLVLTRTNSPHQVPFPIGDIYCEYILINNLESLRNHQGNWYRLNMSLMIDYLRSIIALHSKKPNIATLDLCKHLSLKLLEKKLIGQKRLLEKCDLSWNTHEENVFLYYIPPYWFVILVSKCSEQKN